MKIDPEPFRLGVEGGRKQRKILVKYRIKIQTYQFINSRQILWQK